MASYAESYVFTLHYLVRPQLIGMTIVVAANFFVNESASEAVQVQMVDDHARYKTFADSNLSMQRQHQCLVGISVVNVIADCRQKDGLHQMLAVKLVVKDSP